MTNPIVCGRRVCAGPCGRWRHTVDFPWRWRKRRTKWRGMPSRAKVPTVGSVCAVCLRAQARARYAALPPAAKHAVGVRANTNAAKRKTKLEEQVHRARRAYIANGGGGHAELDLVPFRMWLLAKVRQEGGIEAVARQLGKDGKAVGRWVHGYEWDNDAGWGGWAKCEPRPIRTVSMQVVDEAGVAMDEPDLLDRLYPYTEEGYD
jgi:hypothetical protein